MHHPRSLSWEWAELGSELASGGKCHHESLPLSWPPPALLSLGIFTWYPHWPLQAAVRAAGMQTGRLARPLGVRTWAVLRAQSLCMKLYVGPPIPTASPPFLTPSLFSLAQLHVQSCIHGPLNLRLPKHTPHRFHTQAWSDTVAREAIVLGQSSV